MKAPSVCNEPGCPELTPDRRCATHQKAYRKQTRSVNNDFYKSKAWQGVRRGQLRREPLCRMCGDVATDVDHIVPLSDGGSRYDASNLRSLCRPDHAKISNNWAK